MKKYVVVLFLCIGLFACSQNISPNKYTTGEVGVANHVVKAVVVSMRKVKIDNSSGVGGLAGTGAGAAAGSAIGTGVRSNIVGAIGGAVVGGIAGAAIDKGIHSKYGTEYILKLADKSLISITQSNDINLHIGEHVLIVYGAMTRIIPDTNYSNKKPA